MSTKISALPPSTGLVLTDIFPVVDDPGGVPVTQKATFAQLQTLLSAGMVSSFNTRVGAVTLTLADVSTVADARYVLKAGDTMTGALAIGNGTIVANAPVLSLSQTWNNAAVAFTEFLSNVTATASSSSSLLFDFQKNAVTVLNLRTDGLLSLTGTAFFITPSVNGHILRVNDAFNAANPTALSLQHTLTGGVAAAGIGLNIDQSADTTTLVAQRMTRWITTWTDPVQATRTASTSFFAFVSGVEQAQLIIGNNVVQLGGAGTAALPSLTFRNDPDTGLFFNSLNDIFITAGGVQVAAFTDTTGIILSTSLSLPYVAKTATYTASAVDYTIDCTANSFTINLPTAVGITGRVYVIKNSGVGSIIVDPSGAQLIDSLATQTVVSGGASMIQSTGTGWIVI